MKKYNLKKDILIKNKSIFRVTKNELYQKIVTVGQKKKKKIQVHTFTTFKRIELEVRFGQVMNLLQNLAEWDFLALEVIMDKRKILVHFRFICRIFLLVTKQESRTVFVRT